MIQNRLLPVVLACLALCACDSKSTQSPTAGQGLGGLSSNPTSIPGKSAAMGKDAAAKIQGAQDAAANAANQITGQAESEVVIGGVKFAVPQTWKSITPSSTMTKATYTTPGGGQCNFSTAGGDVASNINRWRTQMTDASGQQVQGDVSEHTVAGFKVYIFKASGTYAAMSGGKQADTAFRGAIVQMPAQSVFVRLTGPAAQIGQSDEAWEQMVMSMGR